MTVSYRTHLIIQYLRRNNWFVTVKDIARKLELTERTVYRELPEVTQTLAACGVTLEAVNGAGMKLSSAPEFLQQLDLLLKNQVLPDGYHSGLRLAIISFQLLHAVDYIKTHALALVAKVSVQTVRNDLKSLEAELADEKLQLICKKSGGVRVIGSEMHQGHYFARVLARHIDLDVFYEWIMDGRHREHPLLHLLNQEGYWDIIQKVFSCVTGCVKKAEIKIADGHLRELILLLTMLLTRRSRGRGYAESDLDLQVNRDGEPFTQVLRSALAETWQITWTPHENAYLDWLVEVIIGKNQNPEQEWQENNLAQKVDRLISEVGRRLGLQLQGKVATQEGLLAHLDRTLSRLRSGMFVANPIGVDIEKNYHELFAAMRESVAVVFPRDYFPDEEIGYLVLYLAMILDQIAARSFRVLVVCTSGMGSSKLLAARLEREIAEIQVQKIISLVDLYEEVLECYDLIISTVPLALDNKNYIMVSPLLNAREIECIKELIRKHRLKKLASISSTQPLPRPSVRQDVPAFLRMLAELSDWGLSLLSGLCVMTDDGVSDDLLQLIETALQDAALIDRSALLVHNGKANHGSLLVPNTQLLYAEFCLGDLQKPAMLAFRLNAGKDYRLDDSTFEALKAMVVLVYPPRRESFYLDFLHDLTLMIIEDPQCIAAFERGDEKNMTAILGQRIAKYLTQQFQPNS